MAQGPKARLAAVLVVALAGVAAGWVDDDLSAHLVFALVWALVTWIFYAALRARAARVVIIAVGGGVTLFWLGNVGDYADSCLRGNPWVETEFTDPDLGATVVANIADDESGVAGASRADVPGIHRIIFERGRGDARDRLAEELRVRPDVLEVSTGTARCD